MLFLHVRKNAPDLTPYTSTAWRIFQVFTTLALLNNIQLGMGKFLPLAVQTASDSWVSISRIEDVLLMEASGDIS